MRVKSGTVTKKRHNKLRKAVKGYKLSRRSSPRLARQAIIKALSYAYRDRRNYKRNIKSLWITRISAGAKQLDVSYSNFMNQLKKANINLDRKILSELATNHPDIFKAIYSTKSKSSKAKTTV